MPQVSATLTPERIAKIKELAERDNRTFSQMTDILLERAIKEAFRKKKLTKNQ